MCRRKKTTLRWFFFALARITSWLAQRQVLQREQQQEPQRLREQQQEPQKQQEQQRVQEQQQLAQQREQQELLLFYRKQPGQQQQ